MAEKGPGAAPTFSGSDLRIGIIHGRWNEAVISSLVSGAKKALTSAGVKSDNIITQSVPGSYELPLATQRMITASQATSTATLVTAAQDLLGTGGSATDLTNPQASTSTQETALAGGAGAHGRRAGGPLDAVIAIGVLIKGSTMHFEYIADSVSHGLMRVQLDTGIPVVFGVLTCLSEDQARTRAGLKKLVGGAPAASGMTGTSAEVFDSEAGDAAGADPSKGGGIGQALTYAEQGHNHGEDWGKAAVEMAVKRKAWGEGRFVE